MSGDYVMCGCWCPCENYILIDDYDSRPRDGIVCDDCKKGIHDEEQA